MDSMISSHRESLLRQLRYRRQAVPVVAAVAVFHQVWCGRSPYALGSRHVVVFDGERDANDRGGAD